MCVVFALIPKTDHDILIEKKTKKKLSFVTEERMLVNDDRAFILGEILF